MTEPEKIEKKLEQLAQEVVPITAKQQAFRRIVNVMKRGMKEYYARFPERATDDRSKDAESASVNGLRDILRILNDYSIEYQDGEPPSGGAVDHVSSEKPSSKP